MPHQQLSMSLIRKREDSLRLVLSEHSTSILLPNPQTLLLYLNLGRILSLLSVTFLYKSITRISVDLDAFVNDCCTKI